MAPPASITHDWPAGVPSGLAPLPEGLALLDIDPDPVDWRWPLTRPPQLAPSANLVAMFGARRPGADWALLCDRRGDPQGVDRDEALAYLRAWCDHAPDLALAKALLPLVAARTYELASAAAIDLATVLEAQLAATEALTWLRTQGMRDEVLDALAAAYLAADRIDDTRLVVEALRAYRSYGSVRCRRRFRELFVVDRARRDAIRVELAGSHGAVCSHLFAHASCPLSWGVEARGDGAAAARADLDACTPLLLESPELLPHAYLTIAAAHWPHTARNFDGWLAFAMFATEAAGAARADELIEAAFANAIRVSDCEAQLDRVIEAVARSPFERVRRLARTTRAECERRAGTPPR